MERLLVVLGLCALVSGVNAEEDAMSGEAPDAAVVELEKALAAGDPACLFAEVQDADVRALVESELVAEPLAWAKEVTGDTSLPDTTYTRYRQFKVTGERPPYEGPYFEKRRLLTREVLAAWLLEDDSRIGRINDLLWSICEETTWVLPAHERDAWTIDLFSAETASLLAHVQLVLGERLPEEIRGRILEEVEQRIFGFYLEHAHDFWWNSGRNNWTGVCAGSVGETFLLLEADPARQAKALASVIEQLERFIEVGFEEDGGCLEGIGYWNYGLTHYVSFAEMLRGRTGGAIDLMGAEKLAAIARYPLAVSLGKGKYASFADGSENASVMPMLAGLLARRAGAEGLCGLMGGFEHWHLGNVLRNVLWGCPPGAASPPLEDVLLPASGVARLTGLTNGKPLVVAAKAGSNGEPHNQNDVGSFVVCVDGVVYLCDPGPGLYSREYFGGQRYKNVFANSFGHSVPRIGGKLQRNGLKFAGTLRPLGEHGVEIRFHGAYPVKELTEAVRRIALEDGKVTLVDQFHFAGAGLEVEEAFMTWHDVEVEGNLARVRTSQGVLELRTDSGVFAAERLEEACRENRKPGTLSRIFVTYAPMRERETRFQMVFVPAGES